MKTTRFPNIRKKIKIIVSTLLVLTLSLILFSRISTNSAKAAWFDDTYAYRVRISFVHNASITTERSVTYSLDTAELITANLMQSDCDDIRFTDQNGKALLYDLTGTCNNSATTFEIIFPTIINGTNVAYAYYSNPAAINGEVDSTIYTALTPSGGDPSETGPTSTDEQGPSPISYWNFDESQGSTANDYSPGANNDLTITNSAWRVSDMCVKGGCLYFDGNADRATKTYSSDTELLPGTGSFSVSAWFKHDSTAAADTLISRIDGVNGVGWKIYMDSSGFVCFGIDQSAGSFPSDSACSTVSYANSQWHHLVAIKSSTSSITLYINGKQIAQDASITSSTLDGTNAGFRVGNDADDGTNGWSGFIDEVKYYNFALSNAQIIAQLSTINTTKTTAASFGEPVNLSSGLIGYWKLDESSWTNNCSTATVTDSSSNGYTGISCPNTTGPTGNGRGKFFRGGTFDGSNDYLQITSSFSIPSQTGSVSVWVYPTSGSTHDILSAGTSLNDFRLSPGNDVYGFFIGSEYRVSYTTDPTLNTWTLVTLTWDQTNGSILYYNGVRVASNSTPPPAFNQTGMHIGSYTDGASNLTGSLDEIRVYNRAISAKEVESLYNWSAGPVAYYNLDENNNTNTYLDTSGNGLNLSVGGTAANFTHRYGEFGSGVNKSGNSDTDYLTYDDTTTSPLDIPTSFSVSTWIRYSATPVDEYGLIVAKLSNGGPARANYFLGNGQSPSDLDEYYCDYTNAAGTSFSTQTTGNRIVTGTWQYVSCIYDDLQDTLSIYINGVRISQNTSATGTPDTGDDDLYMFADSVANAYGNSTPSNTILDEIKIYNYARSSKQIIEDMNGGHPTAGSPVGSYVARWKFDDLSGTTAQDQTDNNNDLTLSAASWTPNGKYDGAWNGTGSVWLTRADDDDLDFAAADDFSISMWFKSDSTTNPSNSEYLLSKGTITNSGTAGYIVYANTSGQIVFGVKDDTAWGASAPNTPSPDDTATSTSDIYDTAWHHIVAVKTGTSKIELFVDGKLESSDTSIAATATLANSIALRVADDDADSANSFNGDLDDIKIYRSALTPSEVLIDMNANSAATFGSVSDVRGPTPAPTPRLSEGFNLPNPDGWWKLDENTGTTTADVSGNNVTGTLSGNVFMTIGKIGGSASFDGVSDHISMGGNLDMTNSHAFTISAWIYPTSNSQQAAIVGKKTSTGTSSAGYNLYWWENANGGNTCLYVADGTNGYENCTAVNTTDTLNRWYHLVAVYDNASTAGSTIYLNGVNAEDSEAGSPTTVNSPSNSDGLCIGTNSAGSGACGASNEFTGKIDDVRIYRSALTPAQVAYLYNRGAPTLHYKFDECSGSTAYNSATNANGTAMGVNGTITPGASGNTSVGSCGSGTSTEMWNDGTTGKFNSALGFDGSDDYITTTNDASIDQNVGLQNGLTISAWIYANSDGEGDVGRIFTKNTNTWCRVDSQSGSNLDMQCSLDLSTDATLNVTGTGLTTGTWNHVALTWTNDADDEISIWINGINRGSSTDGVGDPSADTANLIIGNDSTSATTTFDGLIDDFQIYSYEMTSDQIRRLYNQGSAQRFGPAVGSP